MKLPNEILTNLDKSIGYCPDNLDELDWLERNGIWIAWHKGEQLEVRFVKRLGCYAVAKRMCLDFGLEGNLNETN